MSSLIKNNHILCIQAGGQSIEDVNKKVIEWMNPFPHCSYHYVLGKNYMNEFIGFGYLWVDDPSVYNMLQNLKSDGTKNVEYKEDPNFIPRSTMDYSIDPFSNDFKINWAEEADACIAPVIEVPLPDYVDLSDRRFILSPAIINEEEKCTYLVIKRIPPSIENLQEKLLVITKRYSNHKDYPKIDIRKNKNDIRIYFNPNSYDANFASFMLRKITIDGETISMRLPSK